MNKQKIFLLLPLLLIMFSCDDTTTEKKSSSYITNSTLNSNVSGLNFGNYGQWHNDLVLHVENNVDHQLIPSSCSISPANYHNHVLTLINDSRLQLGVMPNVTQTDWVNSTSQINLNINCDFDNFIIQATDAVNNNSNLTLLDKQKTLELINYVDSYTNSLKDTNVTIDDLITDLLVFQTEFDNITWGTNDYLAKVSFDIFKASAVLNKARWDSYVTTTNSLKTTNTSQTASENQPTADQKKKRAYVAGTACADFLGGVIGGSVGAAASAGVFAVPAALAAGSASSGAVMSAIQLGEWIYDGWFSDEDEDDKDNDEANK